METVTEARHDRTDHSYRPELDSLRAFAIIPVVVFHLNPGWLPGGYLGVDVFFVLSGFLISTIILRDLDNGTFRLRNFYARRVRRLLPAIIVLILSTMVVATLFLADSQRVYVAEQSVASLASVSNFYVWMNTGSYWGPTVETTALMHTWSLSVEEQFYLLFPFFLILAHRWIPHGVLLCFGGLIGLSGLLYMIIVAAAPEMAFYLLPTRAWELAAGGWVASWQRKRRIKSAGPDEDETVVGRAGAASTLPCIVGLGLIAISYFLPSQSRSNEWNTVLAVTGTFCFLVTRRDAMILRKLNWKPAVYIGKISYSWYLWHWPVIVLNRLIGPEWGAFWIGFLGLGAAIGSYHLVEQTTRHRKGVLPWIFAAYVVTLVLACVGLSPHPVEPADRKLYETCRWYGSYYNSYPEPSRGDWFQQVVRDVIVPEREIRGDEFERGGIRFGRDEARQGEAPEIVLLGDSHATMWAHLVHHLAMNRNRSLAVWAINGVDPLFADPDRVHAPDSVKARYDVAREATLPLWKPKLSIISIRWSWYDPERARRFIEFVAAHSEKVLLIGPTPELRIGDANAREHLIQAGIIPNDETKHYLPCIVSESLSGTEEQFASIADSIENVHWLRVQDRYQVDDLALALVGRRCVYLDDDHFTSFGSWLSKSTIEEAIDELLDRSSQDQPRGTAR